MFRIIIGANSPNNNLSCLIKEEEYNKRKKGY